MRDQSVICVKVGYGGLCLKSKWPWLWPIRRGNQWILGSLRRVEDLDQMEAVEIEKLEIATDHVLVRDYLPGLTSLCNKPYSNMNCFVPGFPKTLFSQMSLRFGCGKSGNSSCRTNLRRHVFATILDRWDSRFQNFAVISASPKPSFCGKTWCWTLCRTILPQELMVAISLKVLWKLYSAMLARTKSQPKSLWQKHWRVWQILLSQTLAQISTEAPNVSSGKAWTDIYYIGPGLLQDI